jgi:DNA-directed RNA polymerase specialized sigma subunit
MFSEAAQQKPKKPDWYKETERHLRRKKYLTVEIENLKLQLDLDREAGARVVANLKSGITKKTNISSPTESTIMKYETKEEAIRRKEILLHILENTVKAFNRDEHQIYYLRYECEWKDWEIADKLGVSRSAYFNLQRQVVMKAAQLIGVEIPEDELPEEWKGELFIIEKYLAGRGE